MTDFSPSPSPIEPDSVEPAVVDATDEQLSALLDGELGTDELIDLEERAVALDSTIDRMLAPFAGVSAELAATIDQPAPADLRTQHLGSALDAMDSPEVVSLAAARASQRRDEVKHERAQRLNVRLRRLSAVAAAVAVFGGIGLFALENRAGDRDAATESAGASDEASAASTLLRNSTAGDDVDGASADDGAMETGLAQAESATTTTSPSVADLAEGAPADAAYEVPPNLDLSAVQRANPDASQLNYALPDAGANTTPPVCFDQAAELSQPEFVGPGVVVSQEGQLYELVVLETDELLVFELPDCLLVN